MQLVISYRMNAEYMCEFTNEEFCSGFEEMGVDSIEGLKAKLPALRNLMKDECTKQSPDAWLYTFLQWWRSAAASRSPPFGVADVRECVCVCAVVYACV